MSPVSGARVHWRSLGQLEESPESRAFREREFPEGASEAPDAISRRHVLTLLGASVSLAGLAACRRPEEHIVPYVEAPEQVVPGVPRHYATTMPFGTSAYGLVVESHEGRPTKIEGNELHPATLGSSSARVQAAILDLYDPDRSPSVLRHGERSTWGDLVAAWQERAKVHAGDGGEALAVLARPFASPTLHRLTEAFRSAYPRARVVVRDAAGEANALAGIARAAGRPLVPVQRLEKATTILAIDADFLNADPEMIRHTRGFSGGRRLASPADPMSRLWAVEAVLSVTGANADHRLRLAARRIPALVAALAAQLKQAGLDIEAPALAPPDGVDPSFLRALAADLLASRGRSLVLAGPRQPPVVHAAVLVLNAALGNVGTTVEYHEPTDALLPSGDLDDLVAAMREGRVRTLVVLGGNPAYDAPADLDFIAAARGVEEVIHLGSHVDETGALASWHVPAAHFLEAWDDARASCGTLSVVQPLILPLLGGKTAVEVMGLLASGADRPAYDLVQETWRALLGEADFERRWNRVLHDGLLPDSALPPVGVAAGAGVLAELLAEAQTLASRPGDLDLAFTACPKLHDGASANNAWLQELPDPITKATWDNPLLMSPATAAAHGLGDGDVARVEAGDRSVELPIFRVPGMAEGTLALTLGYGRRQAGRVGTGVGVDAFALRSEGAPDLSTGVRLARAGRRQLLAQTQEHGSMEGRDLVREATLERYRKDPKFATDHHELFSLWKEHEYKTRPQWGMVIDLNACTGCNACAVACQSENNIPVVGKDQVRRGREMAWIRVDRYFAGEPAEAGAVFQPVPCMQCENAPCEQVCPVGATVHDSEGLNAMVYNRCIGTRYCSNNCPYKVRRFNFFNYTKDTPEILKMANNPDVTVRARGVMEKCTYCVQRLSAAKIDARLGGRELRDGDVKTACQQACPAEAIRFGDLLDPESRVARARAGDRTYSLLQELNSRPRTTYQARVRNPHPDLAGRDAGPEAKTHA
jgi:molybdopterin-containing oxidoreductase family iron-sulfur binding subunit